MHIDRFKFLVPAFMTIHDHFYFHDHCIYEWSWEWYSKALRWDTAPSCPWLADVAQWAGKTEILCAVTHHLFWVKQLQRCVAALFPIWYFLKIRKNRLFQLRKTNKILTLASFKFLCNYAPHSKILKVSISIAEWVEFVQLWRAQTLDSMCHSANWGLFPLSGS